MSNWTDQRIPIALPPYPGEALDSWLASYAHRLKVSTRDFLNLLELPTSRPAQMVTRLTATEQRILATATGVDVSRLVAMTLEPFDGVAVTLGRGSRELRRPPCWRRNGGTRSGAGSRYCPGCLEDNAYRWRLEWRLPWIYACPQHHWLLLETCPACGNSPLPYGPSYRGPATPGLCSHPIAATAHGRTLARCRHRLTGSSAPNPSLAPDGPILAGQQHVHALLRSGMSDPEPAVLALREIYALAWRALKGLHLRPGQLPPIVDDVVRDCGGEPEPFTDRKMPERPGQVAVGTAIAVIAQSPHHPASEEVFDWLLRTDGAISGRDGHQQGHRIERWQPAGPRLTARVITSLDGTMNFHQRLRFSSAAPQPSWPALSTDQARSRAAMIPALLWPSWTMRLLPADLTDQTLPHAFRAACSTYLLVPGTRLAFTEAGELLGHTTPRRDRRMIDRIVRPSALIALASALAQLAHGLDAHGSPIDYARRRHLLTLDALPIDRRACERLFREHGWKPGPGRERHMRAYLLHLLGVATGARSVDGSVTYVNDYRRFVFTMPAWLRSFLLDQAQATLAEHGISEPVQWEPPRRWVTDVTLPGVEPDDVDRTGFRDTIAVHKTPARTAAALGVPPEHVRLFASLSGLTAPERRLPQRARGRLVPRQGDLSPDRLRHLYLDQGLSYQRIAQDIGCSSTVVVNALAHADLLDLPSRRPTMVTRAWLAKQCTVRNRALRGISKECGLPVRELRRMAAQWGIPAWTDFDRPLPAPFASLPQPLAPDLHRVLVSTNGPDNLRLICALPAMPSLSAAERALGQPGIRHHLLRIERMVGFTIIERTRPLTATPRGQAFLWRAAHVLALGGQPPVSRRQPT